MAKRLRVPPGLEHLIEKREGGDRRRSRRRKSATRRTVDLGPVGSLESTADLDEGVLKERRATTDRRGRVAKEQRQKKRRGTDRA